MYAVVEAIARDSAVATAAVCEVLAVSRSAFYAWRHGEPSPRERRDAELTPLVRAVFWKHRRRYGARRIVSELADIRQFLQIMEKYNLQLGDNS